ncbi:hypothetical protein RUM43_003982 [Polyplax serrata]|uniref:Uncharacterized protein n=1 Tax=Polyplax serrata TaxID=468196 RepID=A0AAN8SAE4_POLSC
MEITFSSMNEQVNNSPLCGLSKERHFGRKRCVRSFKIKTGHYTGGSYLSAVNFPSMRCRNNLYSQIHPLSGIPTSFHWSNKRSPCLGVSLLFKQVGPIESLPETLEMENNDKRIEKQTGPEGKKHLPGWGEKKDANQKSTLRSSDLCALFCCPIRLGVRLVKVSSRVPKVKRRGTVPCDFALSQFTCVLGAFRHCFVSQNGVGGERKKNLSWVTRGVTEDMTHSHKKRT